MHTFSLKVDIRWGHFGERDLRWPHGERIILSSVCVIVNMQQVCWAY